MRRLLLAALLLLPAPLLSQTGAAGYHNHGALNAALDSLARRYPRLVTVTTLTRSPGGREVQSVRLAAGQDPDQRPALLIVANTYGPDVASSEAALAAARQLTAAYGADTAVTRLLDHNVVYLIPRVNPDAAEAMFASPLAERIRNDAPLDDDHDQAVDEDGPDDLNGDGLITMMRVEDPAGEWMADSAEPSLMRKADPARGEVGRYRLYAEGRDNDGDEQWNEDPIGGIDVNRNFINGYAYFSEGAGTDPFDAPEARAVAQFFVDHPNVAIVYVLGPQDNLIKAWEGHRGGSPGGGTGEGGSGRSRSIEPPTAVMQEDESWYGEVARRFRRITGLEKGPSSAPLEGDPLSFAYFDMGRWAFGTRAWWAPEAPDSTARRPGRGVAGAEGAGAGPGGPGGAAEKDPLKDERTLLRWLRLHRPDGFVEWQRIQDPDFPDKTVEVGGFRPFVAMNPPAEELDSVFARQARFVAQLGGMLPSISIRAVRVDRIGTGVYRLTAQVANDGFLPTASEAGARVRWPRRVRVQLDTTSQTITSGRAIQLLDPIPGSGNSTELTWTIVGQAGSRLTLTASSPVAGSASQTINLR